MKSLLGNTRKADIVFYASGRIDITARVAKVLGLHPGDVIDVMWGGGEFYLYKKYNAPVIGRHDGTVFQTNRKGNHFRVQSKALCTAILRECNVTGKKVKLCVGTTVSIANYDTAIPIITKNVLI